MAFPSFSRSGSVVLLFVIGRLDTCRHSHILLNFGYATAFPQHPSRFTVRTIFGARRRGSNFEQSWANNKSPILPLQQLYAETSTRESSSPITGSSSSDHSDPSSSSQQQEEGTASIPNLTNLSSLGPFSALALLSFAVTVGTLVVRAVDGTYAVAAATAATNPTTSAAAGAATTLYLADLPDNLQPSFGDTVSYLPNIQGVVLLCTLATAFVAHYNAPRFFSELRDSTMERFGRVVITSYSMTAVVFAIVSVAGFATFGKAAQPMILNNYSPFDPLASACRACLAGSIVLTVPLPFVGLRDGVLDLFQVPVEKQNDALFSALSVALLSVVTVVAVNVQDLGLVLSVGGGTFSTAVAAVFPTLMFRAAVENRKEEFEISGNDSADICQETLQVNERQALLALLLMSLSVAVGLSGASIALYNAIGKTV